MACLSCQERREKIARMLVGVKAVVFGGKRRKLAGPIEESPEKPEAWPRREQFGTPEGTPAPVTPGVANGKR